jgi:uncharacterized protein YecE (DUF72 family)
VTDRAGQLSLFGEEPAPPRPTSTADLAPVYADAARIAAKVPPAVHFGTSSWSFPGWRGLVYSREASTSALARDGLREYSAHPLLTTVGVDRSYYAPVPDEDLRRYAGQVPDGFKACFKAPASVTASMTYDAGPGTRTVPNPTFMSADVLVEELLAPCARSFAAHTGPFVLEFPPSPRGAPIHPAEFAERLDALLSALPREFEYAVEIRERALLTPAYRGVLSRHGVAHVYNYWSFMPMPEEQASVVRPEDAPFLLVRLLMRPGTRYEDQREAFRPFNRIVERDDTMRAQIARLVRRIANRGRAIVLVNNKAEGSAPLTIRALAELLARNS